MVNYTISFSAQLENVCEVTLGNSSSTGLSLQMMCKKCGQVSEKTVTLVSHLEWSNIRSPPSNNFQCGCCGARDKVKIIKGSTTLMADMNEAPLLRVDSRGFTLCGSILGSGWTAQSVAGTWFHDIDLSGDFFDYDPIGQCPVSIRAPTASIEAEGEAM